LPIQPSAPISPTPSSASVAARSVSNATNTPLDTRITISADDPNDQIAIDIPPEILAADTAPSIKGLLTAIRTQGFMQAINELIAPYMTPGSPGKLAIDKTGLFNVSQLAMEIPSDIWGISGKYGAQINIVKPDMYPLDSNYYLQIFPIHNELGFNLPQVLSACLPDGLLPEWCGLSAQAICNHGVEIPLVHHDYGWRMGRNAKYLEEWVFRPLELDLKYLGLTQTLTPVQATVGLEFGTHVKWDLHNPYCRYAILSNAVTNVIGMGAGLGVSALTGGNAMLWAHGGAMIGQLTGHGLQYWSNDLCPDEIVTWAGATLGSFDINKPFEDVGRVTNYARIWGHVYNDGWRPNDLKEQAEKAVAPIIANARRNHAIDLAERGGDDAAEPRAVVSPSTISARFASHHL
jgi:non-LEE-encoded effector NleA